MTWASAVGSGLFDDPGNFELLRLGQLQSFHDFPGLECEGKASLTRDLQQALDLGWLQLSFHHRIELAHQFTHRFVVRNQSANRWIGHRFTQLPELFDGGHQFISSIRCEREFFADP